MLRGIVPILVTPFDQHEHIDEDGVRSVVAFNLAAGVHGLGLALGSELLKLTEPERERLIRIVVEAIGGRVPLVVNTGAQSTFAAVAYSRQAVDLGADLVMCLPPGGASAAEALDYFVAISAAVPVPVIIQDTAQAPVPAGLIAQIAESAERVRYAKVETPPQPHNVRLAVERAGGRCAVLGGAGGTYLIEELRRGAVGSMPWPSQPATFVRIWELWQAGDEQAATDLHRHAILPLAHLATTGVRLGHLVHKEVLRRLGVIRSAVVRGPCEALDATTRHELDRVCEALLADADAAGVAADQAGDVRGVAGL